MLTHCHVNSMGKKLKNRKYPLQIRLEVDVEKSVVSACKDNGRTPPKEVNFILRNSYGTYKRTVGC